MRAPLRIRITASPLLAGALSLAHGTAVACAVRFLPGWWMPALAAIAIAVSLIFHVRREALQLAGDAVTELVLKDDGQCEFILLDGGILSGIPEGSTFVAPLLTVINIRPAGRGRRRAAVLMPDSAPGPDLRRVRVWLRHRVRPDAPGSGPL